MDIWKNKKDCCDFTDPPKYSGKLILGAELSKEITINELYGRLDYYADGETKEEVERDIRKQVEKDYRQIMLEMANLGGRALKTAQEKIKNIRTVYEPPHPIIKAEDMLQYHNAKMEDYVTCSQCFDLFSFKDYKTFEGVIGCRNCKAPVEQWQRWGGNH
jgi:uncharacterized CHY-type Zn-finger protein